MKCSLNLGLCLYCDLQYFGHEGVTWRDLPLTQVPKKGPREAYREPKVLRRAKERPKRASDSATREPPRVSPRQAKRAQKRDEERPRQSKRAPNRDQESPRQAKRAPKGDQTTKKAQDSRREPKTSQS